MRFTSFTRGQVWVVTAAYLEAPTKVFSEKRRPVVVIAPHEDPAGDVRLVTVVCSTTGLRWAGRYTVTVPRYSLRLCAAKVISLEPAVFHYSVGTLNDSEMASVLTVLGESFGLAA